MSREANRSLGELLDLAVSDLDELAFLRRADAVQTDLAAAFEAAHGRRAFARLMALRAVNLAVARHHYHHCHTALASRPFQLMLDPVNNCHLSCPGCLHTANPAYAKTFDWPGGSLDQETYGRFLDRHAPLASGLVFYNWGEPLLHKRAADMIRRSKRYLLHSAISTNLSVKFDVPALVGSGLNFLFLSIDGASQEGYGRFRRGGDFELVLDNVRRILAERERQGSGVPFVLWRFLTFEHNVHEVEEGMRLAREIGVDQFSVTTPFAVDWDDPDVRVARSPLEGAYVLNEAATYKGPLDDGRVADLDEPAIDREFARRWIDRLPDPARAEPSRATSATCRWLYQSVTLDARARVFPCCMAPEFGRHKVYGSMPDDGEPFNVPDMMASRLAFADRDAFEREWAAHSAEPPPYCAVCTENPDLTYTLDRDVRSDLRFHDREGLLDDGVVRRLTEWPIAR